jgi:hypothetical protein
MPRTEADHTEDWVEGHLVAQCKALRALCVKNKQVRNGWPDRTVYWWDGVTDLVETKRPKGGRYEPLQLRTHQRLRRMGHNVFVLLTRTQVDAYIALRRAHGKLVGTKL